MPKNRMIVYFFFMEQTDPSHSHRTPAFFKQLSSLFGLFTKPGNQKASQAYADHFLIRQKYVATQASKHVGADREEPAPLLGLTVLDIGCDDRSLGEGLVLRGAEVTAIDVDEARLKQAEESANKFGTHITFIKTRPEVLIQEAQTYDIVLCMNVFKHVKDVKRLVWAARRLTKKDGIVIFSGCNRNLSSWIWHILLAERLFRWRPVGTYNAQRFLSVAKLKEVLALNDMELTDAVGLHFDYAQTKWEKGPAPSSMRWMAAARFKRSL